MQEAVSGQSATTGAKDYRYDAFGTRTTLNAGGQRFGYGYDLHGDVALLLRDTNAPKASYGYQPYGAEARDPVRYSDTADHWGNTSGQRTGGGAYQDVIRGDIDLHDPFSPIRYTAKRLDSGSGGLDLGARQFSPDYKRFLQQDRLLGAGADLGLALSPWNANRYALAGANPANFLDIGGHQTTRDDAGAGPTWLPCFLCPDPTLGQAGAAAGQWIEERWSPTTPLENLQGWYTYLTGRGSGSGTATTTGTTTAPAPQPQPTVPPIEVPAPLPQAAPIPKPAPTVPKGEVPFGVHLDANALIDAIEHSETAAVDAAIGIYRPFASQTAAGQFLVYGDPAALTAFLVSRGGGVISDADPSEVFGLQQRAWDEVRPRYPMRTADATVAATARQYAAIYLVTRDRGLIYALNFLGYVPTRSY